MGYCWSVKFILIAFWIEILIYLNCEKEERKKGHQEMRKEEEHRGEERKGEEVGGQYEVWTLTTAKFSWSSSINCKRTLQTFTVKINIPWQIRLCKAVKVGTEALLCLGPAKNTTTNLSRNNIAVNPQNTLITVLRGTIYSVESYSSTNCSQ